MMRDCKSYATTAEFCEHIGERQGSEALKFVNRTANGVGLGDVANSVVISDASAI
jgi:hypothetical protein